MRHATAFRFFPLVLAILFLASPVLADDVTVSGTVTFSALDGGSLDHDGVANGVFTVDDGDLTIQGTINCNDTGPGNASACAMAFAVSGDLTMEPGSAVYAENRTGSGSGANITFTVGGSANLQGSTLSAAGAIVSSGNTSSGNAGNIAFTVGGTTTFGSGSVVSAASNNGNAGAIDVDGSSTIVLNGLVASGPTSTIAATKYTAEVVNAGSSNAKGGNISIRATSNDEPGVTIGANATIVSQGEDSGSGVVLLEGCGISIQGLVASVAKGGTTRAVAVHSGTTVVVSGAGVLRADSLHNNAVGYRVDIFAKESIAIAGPATGSLFSVNANPGGNNADGGTINVVSTGSTVTATGNALRAGSTISGSDGGAVNVGASGNVTLDGATIAATGSSKGGAIAVRSYSGGVSWQAGVGDVRPTGSAVAVANRGTIDITYCTTVSTAGSSFPTNGSPVGTFPTTTQTCSPAAPTVPVTLPDCNDPPVAVDDAYTVAEGGTLNVPAPGVLTNDTDADGDPITAILVSGPVHASSFTLNADGSFNYVHDGSETTTDSFTYKANDGSLDSNVATVFITITPVNDPPVAVNDNYNVNEGGTINFAAPGVLANDTDPDGPTMTAVLVSGPAHASSFALNADGSFLYVHDGSETTSDSFTYQASDGSLLSNVATAFITIAPVNDAPVANDDAYGVNEGGTLNGSSVLGNDTDAENDSLTAVLVSGPANAASFTFNADGTFTYVHDGSETPPSDSFTYMANDGTANSNVATVTITITAVNDAPVANDDAYNVNEGGTLNGTSVLTNDTDAENDTLNAVLVSGPANASSFTLNPDGTFIYVHDGSETPTSDSFTYMANDGAANSNVATVNITIAPVNDAPVAVDDNYSVDEGDTLNAASVLGNDTDAENDSLTAVLVSGPANASSFTFNTDGTFTYVHDGSETTSDSFTYKANDGSLDSNVATVFITINAVNDAPVAVNDNYNVNEGGTLNGTSVLTNDTDAENDSLTAVLVSGPAHAASFTFNADGTFTYVHNGSETTSDSFTYMANDGTSNSNVATVNITIAPVNDAPVAVNDNYNVNEGGTLNGSSVLANDTDAENNSLTAVLVTGPSNASSFTFNPDGTFTYVHNGSETTSDSFTYTANDGSANSNVATVFITIAPVNDAPVANNDMYTTSVGGTLTVTAPGVLGNDTDADGPSLSAVLVSGPTQATSFTLNADGSFSYTHNGSGPGTDSFTYQATDGSATSNIATVTINILAQPPVAVDDTYTTVGNTELRVGLAPALTPHVLVSGDVLDNDTDPDTPNSSLMVTSFDTTSANGGTVSMDAQGRFSYLPPAGNNAPDSFNYVVSDGTNTDVGTVHINFFQRVWYVNAAHVGASTGRSTEPFTTLSAAQAASFVNDYIHVAAGAYATGITLKTGQSLVGSGVPLVVGAFNLAPATVRPTVGGTIILASGNLVTGLNVSSGGSGISGTAVTGGTITSVGVASGPNGVTLTNTSGAFSLTDVSVLATGGAGFSITGGSPSVTAANLDVTTTVGAALSGNAGSLTITAGSDGSTAATTGGGVIDLSNMTLNVSLLSASSSGGTTGILVQNTTGSFTVTGVGTTAGTGGTVQNASAKGADFRSASNVTLRNMNFTNNATSNGPSATCGNITTSATNNGPLNCNAGISLLSTTNATLNNVSVTGSQQIGIDGQSVSGLTLSGVTVTGNGNEIGEDGVQMANLSGTVTIDGNSLFRDNASSQFEIANASGTMSATVTSSTFSLTNFATTCLGTAPSPGNCTANAGLQMIGYGTATMNSTVTSSLFQNIFSFGLQQQFSAGAGGTALFGQAGAGNVFTNNGLGANVTKTGTGSVNYEIRDNTLSNSTAVTSTFATSMIVVSMGGNATRTGVIDNNSVGTNLAGATASGCFVTGCDGIQVADSTAQGTHNLTISNNDVYHVSGAAIRVTSSGGSTDTFRVRIQSNVANFPDNPTSSAPGIFVQDGNSTPNGAFYTCVDINGNQIQGLWAASTSHKSAIRLQASRAQQFSLTNFNTATEYAPGAVTVGCTTQCTNTVGLDGNAADFVSQQNPLTIAAQIASGGSSASQQRIAASAPWTGTTGPCP